MSDLLIYISLIISITGITTYLYNLIIDYKNKEYTRRSKSKSIWIYGLFIILLLLFILIYNHLCLFKNK